MNQIKLTQYEYDQIFEKFKLLQGKQKHLRQSHIDAVKEGDDRECDAWSLTNDLSNLNYTKLKEINDMLVDAKIIKVPKKDEVSQGKLVNVKINGVSKEYYICNPHTVEYLTNGLSTESPIGKFLLRKGIGKFTFTNTEGVQANVEIISIL